MGPRRPKDVEQPRSSHQGVTSKNSAHSLETRTDNESSVSQVSSQAIEVSGSAEYPKWPFHHNEQATLAVEKHLQEINDPNGITPSEFDRSILRLVGQIGTTAYPLANRNDRAASEFRTLAQQIATRIFENHNILRGLLDQDEASLQATWLKKTKKGREGLLLAAWGGDMSPSHRPDLEALRKDCAQEIPNFQTEYRDAYLLPHINLEDLSKPHLFLLLLKARAQNPPAAFAAADEHSMYVGLKVDRLVIRSLDNHTMMFTGRNTPSTYGQIYHIREEPQYLEWEYSKKSTKPGVGLLVLEAQDRLLKFLVKCTKLIMQDSLLPSSLRPVDRFLPDTMPGVVLLSDIASETPYRAPAQLDFERIAKLLTNARDDAATHAWSLRDDPSYYSSCVTEVHKHTGYDNIGQSILAALIHAYKMLEIWNEALRQAKNLQRLQKQYSSMIVPTNDLPKEYMEAIAFFRFHLRQSARTPVSQGLKVLSLSPPLKEYSLRTSSGAVSLAPRESIECEDFAGRLLWQAHDLFNYGSEHYDNSSFFTIELYDATDGMQRFINSDPRAKALVSPYISSVLAEMAILGECNRQLDVYQPWARQYGLIYRDRGDDMIKNWQKLEAVWTPVLQPLATEDCKSILAMCGAPTGERFYHPSEQSLTKETATAMRSAEQALDRFWSRVENICKQQGESFLKTIKWKHPSRARKLRRTPEWKEPEQNTTPDSAALARNTIPTAHYEVDQRALNVFRALFFHAESHLQSGVIPWADFLHAMVAIGFSAVHPGGANWHFNPTSLNVQSSITFHEPHGGGKLELVEARRYGRQLTEVYGWNGDTFRLASGH